MPWSAQICYAFETEDRVVATVEFLNDEGIVAHREDFLFEKGTTQAQAAVFIRERFERLTVRAKPGLIGLKLSLP